MGRGEERVEEEGWEPVETGWKPGERERVARVALGRKSRGGEGRGGRGYSDKAEGSAGCVEFLGIKGDFCNITNCERKMAEKLRRAGGGRRCARSVAVTVETIN